MHRDGTSGECARTGDRDRRGCQWQPWSRGRHIVGTNLVNILLILGLSALLVPVAFERATLRFDLPAMTAAALLLFLLSIDGKLTRLGGGILRLGGVAYTTGVVRVGGRETSDMAKAQPTRVRRPATSGRCAKRCAWSPAWPWSSWAPGCC